MHESEYVITTDQKPLKYIMESLIQNKKIQHWTTNLWGYNCTIEYIEGRMNICADMLSRLQHPISEDSGCSDPDITDKTVEVNFILIVVGLIQRNMLNMITSMKINNVIKKN